MKSPLASEFGTCMSLHYNFGTKQGTLPGCGFSAGIPGLVDLIAGLQDLPEIQITSVDINSKFVQLVNAPLDTEPQIGLYGDCHDEQWATITLYLRHNRRGGAAIYLQETG